MEITVKQIKYNISKRQEKVKYIVLHDTGNTQIGANALMHFNYFNSGNMGSSADFFVDDKTILKVNDYTKNYTWHCGDGKGRFGITNGNSIGIEMCVNSNGNFLTTLENTLNLISILKKEFPSAIIVRHRDASLKLCPASISANDWQDWFFLKFLIRFSNSPSYWLNNCVAGKTVNGDYMITIINNYVACFKLTNSFSESIDYLFSVGIITSKEYWINNCAIGKTVNGEWAKIVLSKMGRTIQ